MMDVVQALAYAIVWRNVVHFDEKYSVASREKNPSTPLEHLLVETKQYLTTLQADVEQTSAPLTKELYTKATTLLADEFKLSQGS